MSVVKDCKKCGPLTAEQVRFRKTRKETVCKSCESDRLKAKRQNNPEKFKAHGDKFRYIDRPADIKALKCSKCQTEKSICNFNKYMIKVRYPYCRDCRLEVSKNHRNNEENKIKHKKWYQEKYEDVAENARLIKSFGISLEEYNNMLVKQNYCCAICKKHISASITKSGRPRKLHVDHDHLTGTIRGLLCFPCNFGIGYMKDDIEILNEAIKYLST